jgi:MSHA biogenesis protein MshK
MAQRLIAAALLALGASSPTQAAHAQALADPTRPPTASEAGEGDRLAPPPSRLQSVLISPARKLAVIDGKTVSLGGTVEGATLVAIRESEVVLQKGAERETLKLNPGVQMKPVPRLAPAKVTK